MSGFPSYVVSVVQVKLSVVPLEYFLVAVEVFELQEFLPQESVPVFELQEFLSQGAVQVFELQEFLSSRFDL
jgi:hypothetical protein